MGLGRDDPYDGLDHFGLAARRPAGAGGPAVFGDVERQPAQSGGGEDRVPVVAQQCFDGGGEVGWG
ncbi:hypothetical protein GCM10010387_34850 [Streptomyces inusitatus]|uniref:Uncharacterized protein n=1 Tax=Streptomyces inusitatus TaxID=68221 RepID=A0A918Q977_9ACTN|nr:hypothetical protein GCM10010387_34850 [Streptomyces inusitatus]